MIAATWPAPTLRLRSSRIGVPWTDTLRFLISNIKRRLSLYAFRPARAAGLSLYASRPARAAKRFVWSSHTSLEADGNQFLSLNREFHRQLLQHVADEAVDDQGCRLFGRQPTLQTI